MVQSVLNAIHKRSARGRACAGRIVESFTDPERDPLQAELYENPPKMADGWLTLNEDPGIGLTLSEAAVEKFGTCIS